MRAATIWGRERSSSIAFPSAIRSGQKATSIACPDAFDRRSTKRVTPGKTVERRISTWPSDSAIGHLLERGHHGLRIGVEVLVDGSADHDDQVLTRSDRALLRRGRQRAVSQRPRKHLRSSRLEVGHLAGPDGIDRGQVRVVEGDPQPRLSQRQTKG